MSTQWHGCFSLSCLGALFAFSTSGRVYPWTDEGFTWRWIYMSQYDLWNGAGKLDVHPPLYYSLQRLWLVFGDSEFAMRALPALIGTATIPVTFMIGRTAAGRQVGLIAAVLAATNSVLVDYSQEARNYALLCFSSAIAILGMIGFLRSYCPSFDKTLRSGICILRYMPLASRYLYILTTQACSFRPWLLLPPLSGGMQRPGKIDSFLSFGSWPMSWRQCRGCFGCR